MEQLQQFTASTLVRAQQFIDEHDIVLGAAAVSRARGKLRTIVSALDAHSSAQSEFRMTAQMLTQSKAAARRVLLQDHLAPIAAAARAQVAAVQELAVVRALPRKSESIHNLLTRAEDTMSFVTPLAGVLVDAGLPEDFIAQLQVATDTLRELASRQVTSRSRRMGATTGIREQLAAGRRQVALLDRLVRTVLRGSDGALLTEWKTRIALPAAASTLAPRTEAPVVHLVQDILAAA